MTPQETTIIGIVKSVEGNTTEYAFVIWRWSIALQINHKELAEALGKQQTPKRKPPVRED
jgi:hypothetical protein